MSFVRDILGGLQKIVVLEHRVTELNAEVSKLSEDIKNHEGRLIRIETMIEMSLRDGARPRLDE